MNYIKTQLDKHFISNSEFSKLLGLDRSHLNKLMKGHHIPRRKTIRLIAQGLERLSGKNWQYHAREIIEELEER